MESKKGCFWIVTVYDVFPLAKCLSDIDCSERPPSIGASTTASSMKFIWHMKPKSRIIHCVIFSQLSLTRWWIKNDMIPVTMAPRMSKAQKRATHKESRRSM